MSINRKVIKCIYGDREYKEAANDELYLTDHKQLEKQLKTKKCDVVYIAKQVNFKRAIKLAFEHQAILYINKDVKYDFSNKYDCKQSNLENAIKLLRLAAEPVLLYNAVNIVSDIRCFSR